MPMGFAMNPSGSWQQVAIFEVEAGEVLGHLMARLRVEFNFSEWMILPMPRCLPARVWFEARVDFGIGERRAIHLASRLIEEIGRAELPGYRLVAGREWLDLALAQMYAETGADRGLGDPAHAATAEGELPRAQSIAADVSGERAEHHARDGKKELRPRARVLIDSVTRRRLLEQVSALRRTLRRKTG